MKERKMTPQDRYAAKYKKQYSLPCFTTTEQDIIDRLESEPNKAGYIKKLIRADMGNGMTNAERNAFVEALAKLIESKAQTVEEAANIVRNAKAE